MRPEPIVRKARDEGSVCLRVRLGLYRRPARSAHSGREFYDLGSNLLLTHHTLRRQQRVEIALDLTMRSRHSLHARLIFRSKCVQGDVAELGMDVGGGEFLEQRRRVQISQWRVRESG